jgi:hypothetical protein
MHKLLSKLFISNLILFSLLFESDITLAQKKLSFPKDWLGKYQGNLEMITTQGTIKIPMTLTFEKTEADSIYKWKVVYDSTAAVPFKVEKDYLIKTVNAKKGQYLLDEQNGIVLHLNLIDNTLYSCFSISSEQNEISLTSTDKILKKGVIYHEILSFNPMIDKDFPNEYGVKSSRNIQVQKAILRKKK